MTDVQASLEEYRDVREALERAVLPLATSVDGRRFSFQISLHELELEAGGYVTLEGGGRPRLGQVLSLELRDRDADAARACPQVRIRAGHGEGVVLDGDGRPFHDAAVRRPQPDEVGAWLDRDPPDASVARRGRALARARRAGPARRRRLRAPHVPVRPIGLRQDLLAGRPAGAAPDGDEPARGRARPELGLRAARRAARGDADPERARALRCRGRARSRSGAARTAPIAIRVRFRELSPAHQAALLRLDPLADREEYAELTALLEDESIRSLEDLEHARPTRSGSAHATSASSAGASGRGARASRWSRSSRTRTGLAAWSWTWARWARARSRRSRRAPCSSGSGAAGPRASRSRS